MAGRGEEMLRKVGNNGGGHIRRILASLILLMLAAGTLAAVGCGQGENEREVAVPASAPDGESPDDGGDEDEGPSQDVPGEPFVQESFNNNATIHFASSEPPNNALLEAVPEMVTIRFNSDLGSGSFIRVTANDIEVSAGGMILPADNRSMSVRLNPYMGTGNYGVTYSAYWVDGTYCDGSFGFSVKIP